MPKPEPSQLTPLQMDVMRVLWTRVEATAADVHAALAADRGLAHTTVATLLRRLEKRGLVAHRSEGRQFVFRALVDEEAARDAMVEELADRLFGGDAARLVHHLIARHELRPGDLERVRDLIDDRTKKSKKRRPRRAAR